jgi:hypothetical protein
MPVLDPNNAYVKNKQPIEAFIQDGYATQFANALDPSQGDRLHFQVQGIEGNTTKFDSALQRLVEQAHAAKPTLRIGAGISSSPSGQTVTSLEVFQAAEAAKALGVDLIWFNNENASAFCPQCPSQRQSNIVDEVFSLEEQAHPSPTGTTNPTVSGIPTSGQPTSTAVSSGGSKAALNHPLAIGAAGGITAAMAGADPLTIVGGVAGALGYDAYHNPGNNAVYRIGHAAREICNSPYVENSLPAKIGRAAYHAAFGGSTGRSKESIHEVIDKGQHHTAQPRTSEVQGRC